MPSETQAEKIAALDRRLSRLETELSERSVRYDQDLVDLKSRVRDLERRLADALAELVTVTERAAALQRQSDRG